MGDRHDYVALEWVKGEIAETLRQARQALEAYVENPEDSTRVRFCLTYIHQVHGTLQMVEFYGAALLAEEMEQLARALLDERVANRNEALEVLMQAILQLPTYLERIQGARRDLPMVVLPLLNDLRAARGEKLLSETSLFAPDLTDRQPALNDASLALLRTNELPTLLRKLRQMLQVALVGVIRNQDLPTNLGYMARVFGRLETLSRDAPLGALWQIASGLIEGMASGAIVNGSSVRTLLRQVDRELKRLVEQGAEGFNQPATDELTKNLLFYVAKAPAQTPRITALKQRYRLDDALPDERLVDEERAQLAGPDRSAMRSVVMALCEELVRVKDSLDLFVRSDRKGLNELNALVAPLKQIADTLAMLGFGQPRRIVLDQLAVVQGLLAGQGEPTDAVLMDVAGALLYVEATLAGMAGGGQEERTTEEAHLPTTDVAQIHRLVIKEARTALEQAKDAIIEFIASQWNHDHLARVPELLTQARGGLEMIPLERSAGLLDACNRYIQEQLLARKAVPDWQSLDTLADAITSVEYYLERLGEDHASQGDLILDVAEESLDTLGYPIRPQAEAAALPDLPLADAADLPTSLEALEPSPVAQVREEDQAHAGRDDWGFRESDALEPDEPIDYLSLIPSESEPETPVADVGPDIREWSLVEELAASQSVEFELAVEDLPAEEDGAYDVGEDAAEPLALEPLSEAEMIELELPEVELPSMQETADTGAEAAAVQGLAEVMAAPVRAINPPALDVPESLLPPPADEEPVDEELAEVFIEEAGEVLETIHEFLPRWVGDSQDKEALTEVRRAFHTLKGSGRMVRALIIGELAWSIENLLNRVLDRSIEASAPVQQVVQAVVDLMPELVDEYAAKAQRQRDDVDRLAATAHLYAKGQLPAAASEVAAPAVGPVGESPVADEPVASGSAVETIESLDPQLLEIFRNEAEHHLDTLVGFLADCAQRLPQPVTDALQRALHTLKGSAHMAGILPMAEIAMPLEKMLKEFKTHHVEIDLPCAQLLHRAEQLFREGLENLDNAPLKGIDGSEAFLADVQALHQGKLRELGDRSAGERGEGRDPRMISLFLSEGMNILLDAEDLLHSWREHPAERQELTALLEELTTLGLGAQMANLPQIDALCQALLSLYTVAQDGHLTVSQRFFEEVEQGHEALVAMMDQVAAGLQVSESPETVRRLEALLADLTRGEGATFQAPEASIDAPGAPLEPAAAPVPVPVPPIAEVRDAPASATGPSVAPEEPPFDCEGLDGEMVEIFLDEAVDLLDSAGQALERWLNDPQDQLALSGLQRDLHTLKGGARMAEIRPIGDLAHELESLYEGLVDRRYSGSVELGALLQRSHDHLAVQLEQLQHGQPMAPAGALIAAIVAFRTGRSAATADLSELQAPDAELEEPPAASFDSMPTSDRTPVETESTDEKAAESVELANQNWLIEPESALGTEAESVEVVAGEQPQPEAWLPAEPEPVPEIAKPDEAAQVMAAEAEAEDGPDSWGDRDPELVEIFLEEGLDIIESAGAALQRWMDDVGNSIEVEALQRDLHTLKGGARMAEIAPIGDLAHELESLYEGLCGGRLRPGPQLFSLLQTCHDRLADMLEALQARRPLPDGSALIDMIRQFRVNPAQQLEQPASVSLKSHAEPRQDDVESEILDIFVEEATDLLEELDGALNRLSGSGEDRAALADMLRILHTLKGGARLAGQTALGDMAHDLEQLLGEVPQGEAVPAGRLDDAQGRYDTMLQAVEDLRARLQGDSLSAPAPEPAEPAPVPVANDVRPVQPSTPIVAASAQPVANNAPAKVLPFVRRAQEAALDAAARRAPQELVKVPADLLEGLVNLAGETSIFRGRVEQQVSDVGFTLSEMEATIERVRDQLRRLDTETQAQILSRYQAEAERAGYEDFDPLEMDRHSQLQQLSRALFESASDLLDLKETLAARNRDAETLLLQQARVNTELQEGLMRTRMVPFDRLVPRLRRIVRQVAGELGKQVEFVVGNAEGEMDRTVLERIVAPLEHMLRNAVDHGIESVERRQASGKPAQGTIRLDLGREGGDIVLTLADDGGGINLEAVRRKAIERGLMSADSELPDQEVLQFILEAGFSTAERVTQISGRGVGMDVVHSEVKQLGGSMSIESTLGEGTRFLIRLPFTVSVNRALMVHSGEDLYAIPLNTIEGIVRVSPYELESYYQPGAPRFEYAGEAYELRYLGELLDNGQQPKLGGHSLPLPVILVRSSEHAVAVQVDSLAGSREIVVKSLGAQFAGVHGISGATILGDGRVVVILDLLATIRARHMQQLPPARRPLALVNEVPEKDVERPVLVMVVDDSVTVRKVTSRLLERNGMNVLTAKDGVDAITQLQDHHPDIMLLDIEMPRMDGFEVASLVRHDERLADLPIVMITSRTGDKHRDRAMSIGVNEYLGKPYQESLLLETIQRLVRADD